jgi:hypothetical protein
LLPFFLAGPEAFLCRPGERMSRSTTVFLTLLLSAAGCTVAPRPAPSARLEVAPVIHVVDLTPKFLAFYDSARKVGADGDQRWALFQQLYNFSAVPPTPMGRALARTLLDSAWSRYPAAIATIRLGPAALGIAPDSALARVAALLACAPPPKIQLMVYVGGFETNAFAFPLPDGTPAIALPVEAGDHRRSLVHELTHAVHSTCAGLAGRQSVARLVIAEGLAMRATERLLPGHPATYYTTAAPGWFEASTGRRIAILQGIRAQLADTSVAASDRFTLGAGTTGLPREGYYAGWEVVGFMTQRMGMSFHDVASMKQELMVAEVGKAIDRSVRGRGELKR